MKNNYFKKLQKSLRYFIIFLFSTILILIGFNYLYNNFTNEQQIREALVELEDKKTEEEDKTLLYFILEMS